MIVATLDWYDEQPETLRSWVAAVAPIVDAVVSVDGAYAHFPGGRGCSPFEQRKALGEACLEHGLTLQMHDQSGGPWESERVKHTYELQHGAELAGPGGWLLRLDADELVRSTDPSALRMILYDVDDVDVLTFDLFGVTADGTSYRFPLRRLIRAFPGLVCEEWHDVVQVGRRYLAGHPHWLPLEPTRHIYPPVLEAEHRPLDRTPERQAAKSAFYKLHAELDLR